MRTRNIALLLAITILLTPLSGTAQSEEKKPRVLVVYADWCPLCQNLKPALALINEKYRGQIRFVLLDVTSEATMERSRRQAHVLGLEDFFQKNYVTTSLVVIQDASGHEIFRAVHDYDFQHYAAVLDRQVHPKQK